MVGAADVGGADLDNCLLLIVDGVYRCCSQRSGREDLADVWIAMTTKLKMLDDDLERRKRSRCGVGSRDCGDLNGGSVAESR